MRTNESSIRSGYVELAGYEMAGQTSDILNVSYLDVLNSVLESAASKLEVGGIKVAFVEIKTQQERAQLQMN